MILGRYECVQMVISYETIYFFSYLHILYQEASVRDNIKDQALI